MGQVQAEKGFPTRARLRWPYESEERRELLAGESQRQPCEEPTEHGLGSTAGAGFFVSLSSSVAPFFLSFFFFPLFLVAAPLRMVFPEKGSLSCRLAEQLSSQDSLPEVRFGLESLWFGPL